MPKTNMSNPEYWQKRAELNILAAEKSAEEMTAGIKKVFEETEKAINKEIQAFYGKYATETGLSIQDVQQRLNRSELKSAREDMAKYYTELEKYKYDPNYKEYLRSLSARAYMSRLEELKMNVRREIEILYAKQQDEFNKGLSNTYEDNYYRAIFDVQQGVGLAGSFTALNTRVIEKAVSQKWLGENYSSRIWDNKDLLLRTLNNTIPTGFALGQNPRVIAKTINDNMFGKGENKGTGGAYGNILKLVRTEFNNIANQASFDSYEESGIVEKYKYLATLDEKTSQQCQDLEEGGENNDGVFLLSEKIEGVNFPPVHPNCRSTTIPYFPSDEIDAMFDKAVRAARDPITGKTVYVPSDMTFRQWREAMTVEENKAFLTRQKMDKYYQSDKDQFANYKKFISGAKQEHGKETVMNLFEGFPSKFSEFQDLKYQRPDKWEIFKENRQKLG